MENEQIKRLLHRLFGLMDGETTGAEVDRKGIEIIKAVFQEKDRQITEIEEKLDLMVDEFIRIKCTPYISSEACGICDRAITDIKQHVPLINQRDEAYKRVMNLEKALNKIRDKGSIVCPCGDWAEEAMMKDL